MGLLSTVQCCCCPCCGSLPEAADPMERWREPVELTPEEDCMESELRHLALEAATVEVFS